MARASTQARSIQTRVRLLDAAIGIIETKGYGLLSIHEVARGAGMTSGAVQHHFASKSDLMLQVLKRLVDELESSPDFWPSAHWSLRRRADHFVAQAWRRFYGPSRFRMAWAAYLSAADDPILRKGIQRSRFAIVARFHARMLVAFPELASLPDAEAQVDFILSALRGIGVVRPFAPPARVSPQLAVLSDFIQRLASTAAAVSRSATTRRSEP